MILQNTFYLLAQIGRSPCSSIGGCVVGCFDFKEFLEAQSIPTSMEATGWNSNSFHCTQFNWFAHTESEKRIHHSNVVLILCCMIKIIPILIITDKYIVNMELVFIFTIVVSEINNYRRILIRYYC